MARAMGLVGLPNVGKSTLCNALSRSQVAEAANYAFCTIEPNTALLPVPDTRLNKLAEIAGSSATVFKQAKVVDIAGLIRGASEGAGLGNKFLSHIREVDAVLQVVRCFEDDDVMHVEESVDPLRDIDILTNELVFADLVSVEKRVKSMRKKKDAGGWASLSEAAIAQDLLHSCLDLLTEGTPVSQLASTLSGQNLDVMRRLQLLSSKPSLFVLNVGEEDAVAGNAFTRQVVESVGEENAVVLCAQLEEEAAGLDSVEETEEYLSEIGLEETGLSKILRHSGRLLHRQTFYTVGPTESRAWDIPIGVTAQGAAGAIHTDMAKGFIRADVTSYDDYIDCGSDAEARKRGLLRSEGKEYIVQDGDVMLFRFNN